MDTVFNQDFREIGLVDNLFTKLKTYSKPVGSNYFQKINQHFQQSIILSFLFKLLNLKNNKRLLFEKGPKNYSGCNRNIQRMFGSVLRNFQTSIAGIDNRLLNPLDFVP